MNEVIAAAVVGMVVGIIFGFLDLPIPAPPALSGVMGIVGIFAGYKLVNYVMANWDVIVELLPF